MRAKLGIIGLGRMGRRHIQSIRMINMELVATYDQSKESLNLAKEEHELKDEQICHSLDQFYSKGALDCVIVATTADSHCKYVCDAAARNIRYILVEKPLATSLNDCEIMINTCKQYGSLLSVNHQMRFMEQYKKPKNLMNSARFGGLTSMTVIGGNFGLAMNGTHYIEAFRYLTDEIPIEVTAWFYGGALVNPRGDQFEDRAGSMRIITEGGARLYIDVGPDQGHGIRVIYGGRYGQITVDELSGDMIMNHRKDEYRNLPSSRYGMPAEISNLMIPAAEVVESTAHTLDALLHDRFRVTPEEGMMAIKVLVAAYESAENGSQPVRLTGRLNEHRTFPWA